MRKVASYALVADAMSPDEASALLTETSRRVDSWLESKGQVEAHGGQEVVRLLDGREAQILREKTRTERGAIDELGLVEPGSSGLFATNVVVGRHESVVAVHVELRAGEESHQVQPLHFDVRCPQIVREIADGPGEWRVGDIPIATKPIAFEGTEGGRRLVQVLWHKARNLPVVVVSTFEGREFEEGFSEALARDLCGLALVATIDADSAWTLTYERGREWSCYNGALRVYWPSPDTARSPHDHPLWTHQRLLSGVDSAKDAAGRIRRQLRRRILGLSAFSIGEPSLLSQIRREAREEEVARLRETNAADVEWRELANSYASDNDRLQEQLDEARNQINDLQVQVRNLQSALQWQPEDQEVSPDEAAPPATVKEAVAQAKESFSDILLFGRDVESAVSGLASDAGPPEKVLAHLERLAELGRAMNRGPIGMTAIHWLRDRGVDASPESETIRNAGGRSWWVEDQYHAFDLHTKPADATSPDRCVRIYFAHHPELRKMLIGWVGRHP